MFKFKSHFIPRSVLKLSLGLTLAALTGGVALAQNQPIDDPIPEPIPDSSISVGVETVSSGLTAPVWGTTAPGQADHLYVVDQAGALWNVNVATGDRVLFGDLSSRLVPLGAFGPGTFDERGFLGLAFHPDYQNNGLLYTFTSEPTNGPADFSTMPAGTDPNQASSSSAASSIADPSSRTSSANTSSATSPDASSPVTLRPA